MGARLPFHTVPCWKLTEKKLFVSHPLIGATVQAPWHKWGVRGCSGALVNWAGAAARALNWEDALASHFSCPIDPCSGGATGEQLSVLHHCTITLISISPAPLRDRPAWGGDELVWSARLTPFLGEFTHFWRLFSSVWSWHGTRQDLWKLDSARTSFPHLVQEGCFAGVSLRSPPSLSVASFPPFFVWIWQCLRGILTRCLKRLPHLVWKTQSVELKHKVIQKSTDSLGSFTVPSDHAVKVIDLGKVVLFSFLCVSDYNLLFFISIVFLVNLCQ